MTDLAFFNTAERTEYSDELYAVVGRALTFATHYDNKCKALANAMDIRENRDLMENPEKFQSMLRKWSRRQLKGGIDRINSKLLGGLQNGDMSGDIIEAFENTIVKFLNEGREARNFIAHELSLGLSEQTESEEFRQKLVETTKAQVGKVAKADFYISVLIEKDIIKTVVSPSEEDYVERVVKWVSVI